MKITNLSSQQRDPNRVNIIVDGKYRFSLDVSQVIDLKIKIGNEYSDEEMAVLETEGQFGKLYARALEYCLMRPHSGREVRDYLFRKTFTRRVRNKRTGEVSDKPGYTKDLTGRVFNRLVDKGYIDDKKFARFWVENRYVRKGISLRKLRTELAAKGIEKSIVEECLSESERSDHDELQKIIAKKRSKYTDDQKFMQYLQRQGFSYDDIKSALT